MHTCTLIYVTSYRLPSASVLFLYRTRGMSMPFDLDLFLPSHCTSIHCSLTLSHNISPRLGNILKGYCI